MARRRKLKSPQEKGADLVAGARHKVTDDDRDVPGPSPNPATNLIMADIIMRAGSYVLRDAVERGFLKGRYGKDTAKNIVNARKPVHRLTSFAAAKVATRSVPGAIVVGGAILAKNLLDRSQRLRKAKREGDRELLEQAKSAEDT
ncbi:hypothetical protein ACXYN8_02430 [Altererythrobacter sp. CAU 1778]